MMQRLYIPAWIVCLTSWAAVLTNYVMSYSFLGCDGRGWFSLALCQVMRPSMDALLAIASVSLPALTVALIVRVAMFRRIRRWEMLLAAGSLLLLAACTTFFPSS
jgi:hypothetical protein